jgi:hypothetical protein
MGRLCGDDMSMRDQIAGIIVEEIDVRINGDEAIIPNSKDVADLILAAMFNTDMRNKIAQIARSLRYSSNNSDQLADAIMAAFTGETQ